MKKSIKRIISLAIAVIMVASAFATLTFTTNAAESTDPLTDGLTKLLSMDDLAGTNKVLADGTTVDLDNPWLRDANQGVKLGTDGKILKNNGKAYVAYAVQTNIPLNTSSKYTVQFTYQRPDTETNNNMTEFIISGIGELNISGNVSHQTTQGVWVKGTNKLYAGRGNLYDSSNLATPGDTTTVNNLRIGDVYPITIDEYSLINENIYTLVIDGTCVYVYINGIFIADFDFVEDSYSGYTGKYLSLGCHGQYTVANDGEAFAIMKDITVYNGISAETAKSIENGICLLNLTSLNADAKVTGTGTNVSLTQIGNQNVQTGEDKTGIYISGSTDTGVLANNQWTNYGVNTDLPLTAQSKYVIEYEANPNGNTGLRSALCFSRTANGNAQGIFNTNNSTVSTIRGYSTGIGIHKLVDGSSSFQNFWTYNTNGYQKFHIVIDGMKATMYVGGAKTATYDFSQLEDGKSGDTGYPSAYLTLAFKTYTNQETKTGDLHVNVRNIVVYNGNSLKRTVTFEDTNGDEINSTTYNVGDSINYPTVNVDSKNIIIWKNEAGDIVKPYMVTENVTLRAYEIEAGEALLTMSTLNSDAVDASASDSGVSVTQINPQNATKGEDDGINFSTFESKDDDGNLVYVSPWTNYGVTTNLPLGGISKYTIEYKAKLPSEINDVYTAMCFAQTANNNAQGLFTYNHVVSSVRGYSTGYYTEAGGEGSVSFKNIWTAFDDKDGYTTFHVEIDGYNATLYIGGRKAGTWDISNPTNDNNAGGFESNYLTLTFKQHIMHNAEGENEEAGAAVANVKDITVYAGNIMSGRGVTFYDLDGNVMDASGFYEDGEQITFPEITAAEGKQIIWKVEHTNVIALAPYTVAGPVTFTAHEVDNTQSFVAGSQLGDINKETNKVNIRFVGGIYDLDGDKVGFEISTGDKKWDRSSNVVYKSIIEVVNGQENTVSADKLGASYLFALSLSNVPAEGEIIFTVKPYKVVGGEKKYGEEATITIKNGAYPAE